MTPGLDIESGTRFMIKSVMTDLPDKSKFRISQNIVGIVYRGDSENVIDLEEEKNQMQQLLAKSQSEYQKFKAS